MKTWLCGILLLFWHMQVAQNCGRIEFETWQPAKSIGLTGVYSMFQDTTGLIWLGTNNGLYTFNGAELKEIELIGKEHLGRLNYSFLQDNLGNVIIGSNTSLCRYTISKNKIELLVKGDEPFNFFSSYLPIGFDSDNKLWCAISGLGIGNYNGSFHPLAQNKTLQLNKIERVRAVLDRTTNTIHFSKLNFSNFHSLNYNITTNQFSKDSVNIVDNLLITKNYLLAVESNTLKVLTKTGRPVKNISLQPYVQKGNQLYQKLLLVNDSIVWYSLKTGIVEINLSKLQVQNCFGFKGDEKCRELENISAMFKDKQGCIFVCTENYGIYVLNTIKAKRFQHCVNTDPKKNTIMQTFPVNDSLLLVSALSEGIQLVNIKTNHFQSVLSDKVVTIQLYNLNDSLYLAAGLHFAIWQVNKRTLKAVPLKKQMAEITHGVTPYTYFCLNNTIYLATETLYKISLKNGRYNVNAKVPLEELKQSTKIIYHPTKRHIILNENKRTLVFDTNLKLQYISNRVIGTFNDYSYNSKEKHWYFAGFDGLKVLNEDFSLHKVYTKQNSTINNDVVYTIVLDNNNTGYYLSTNKGISYFDLGSHQFTNYTTTDGVPASEHNSGAGAKSKKGLYYFGNINGITIFDENTLHTKQSKPYIIINSIKVADSSYHKNTQPNSISTLELQPQGNDLSIDYSILQTTAENAIQYSYKLIGNEEKWTTSSNKIPIHYSNLASGQYTLALRAQTESSDTIKVILIKVLPPYHQTWWFKLLALLLLISIVVFAVRGILGYKLRKRERELETERKLFEQKKQISRELHDNVGARLSMMLNTLSWINKTKKAEAEDLKELQESTKVVIQNLRETIWVMNSKAITATDLCDRIKNFSNQFFKHTDIAVSFNEDLQYNPNLRSEQALAAYRIVQEALNNTFKHAAASAIVFNFTAISKQVFKINYADNGKGFDPTNESTGHGLHNMKQRAKEIDAKFNILSSSANGCTISLEIYTI